jgi:hypothetical protein
MRLTPSRTTVSAFALALLASAPRIASAQNAGNGYLFHAPEARITLRGGYALAAASSDLFDFAVENLTLNRRDFSGLTLGAEIGIPVSERWDISIDGGYSRSSKGSSFRHYIDNNDAEIEQTTTFERVPIMLNARYSLVTPGRTIGTLAWIPTHVVPWVGAGAGLMYYRFAQKGDFVDYTDLSVFPAEFSSNNWTQAVQGMGGFDVSLTPMFAITSEVRYIWARGSVQASSFSGFNKLDLSGASATVGLTVRM